MGNVRAKDDIKALDTVSKAALAVLRRAAAAGEPLALLLSVPLGEVEYELRGDGQAANALAGSPLTAAGAARDAAVAHLAAVMESLVHSKKGGWAIRRGDSGPSRWYDSQLGWALLCGDGAPVYTPDRYGAWQAAVDAAICGGAKQTDAAMCVCGPTNGCRASRRRALAAQPGCRFRRPVLQRG